jgi:hypothetical protein
MFFRTTLLTQFSVLENNAVHFVQCSLEQRCSLSSVFFGITLLTQFSVFLEQRCSLSSAFFKTTLLIQFGVL